MNLKNTILSGRVLTRSGDQAWDFAVPLAILKLVPGELQYAALYYFFIRLSNVFFLPKLSKLIDRINRFKAAKLGIFIQLLGVLIGFIALTYLASFKDSFDSWLSLQGLVLIIFVFGGILGSLGSSFMDIAIANDLVPASIKKEELASFNGRLRQVDLLTELSAPIIAGWLLTLYNDEHILYGFGLVALWNLISFFPEYGLLKLLFGQNPNLSTKVISISKDKTKGFVDKLTGGWKVFLKEPIAIVAIAYACLWLSVLSPHGVLLTGYLKDGWSLPEWGIGIFRGLGGLFGLLATVIYPILNKRYGTDKTSKHFLHFQLFTVTLALISFFIEGLAFQVTFLILILFSRIGLYGFSLGEVELRQIHISDQVRGEFNGFASALTSIATLGLYGGGALLPNTGDFKYLVIVSWFMILVAVVLFSLWSKKMVQK